MLLLCNTNVTAVIHNSVTAV